MNEWLSFLPAITKPSKPNVDDKKQTNKILENDNHLVKDLTDEEIDEISKEVWERPWLEVHRKFAKAILRKAQEK